MLGAEAVERLRMRIWKTRPDVESGARCTAAAEKNENIFLKSHFSTITVLRTGPGEY